MHPYFHIGHKKIISLMKKQIESRKFHHAYIFIGPPNVGKLDLAKYFATLIHGNRNSIREKIEKDIHPDTIIIYPKKAEKTYKQSISIKKIQGLIRKINFSPHSSNFKVGIISDAQLMGGEAANAFLKTLEEPPKASILILITSKENLIPATILSRCQKLYLGLVSRKEILKNLLEQGVKKKDAEIISRLAAGKPGLAIQLTKKDALKIYQKNLSILEKIFKLDNVDRIKEIEAFSKRKDITEILDNWLIYFRDFLIEKNNLSEMAINFDRIEKIKKQSDKIKLEKIKKIIQQIIESQDMLAANANPRLVLENLVLGM